jgi:glycine/D-amino acid oxidase-like deaminating enzyme
LRQHEEVIFLPNGGFVMDVGRALEALEVAAEDLGVRIDKDESVVSIDRLRKELQTDAGQRVKYDQLIVCAGP